MASTDIAPKERFAVLDGMRGLAALVVITDHVPSDLLTTVLPGRYLAVDFFFILSGFVLAHVYEQRLRTGLSVLGFLRVRLVRLYPLYIVGALIGAALAALYVVKGWSDASPIQLAGSFLFALLLLPCPPGLSLWANAPFPLNGPSWSLFFELLVNVVFACVARWLTPRVSLTFVAVGAVLLVPTAFGFGQLDGGFAWSNFVAGFPRVTFGFFAGVWLYQRRAQRRAPVLPAWAAYLALLIAFTLPATGAWRAALDLAIVLFVFPALVAMSADSPARGAVLRVSSLLGLLSYGIYVLHVPLWGGLTLILDALDLSLPGWANVVLAAGVAAAVAGVLHVIYDAPLRRLLSRRRAARAAE